MGFYCNCNQYLHLSRQCMQLPSTGNTGGQWCCLYIIDQEQIVTVWDDDDHNGGHMHINPLVYPVCFGNSANVRFQDLTQFNCVPPQERDNPNVNTRWIQWIYGTDITMTGSPVTIDGHSRTFPYTDAVITLTGPVTGSEFGRILSMLPTISLLASIFRSHCETGITVIHTTIQISRVLRVTGKTGITRLW